MITQLNVLHVLGHDTATIASETGETLTLLRFASGCGDHSPWMALTSRQLDDLLEDLKTRQQAAIEHDYSR